MIKKDRVIQLTSMFERKLNRVLTKKEQEFMIWMAELEEKQDKKTKRRIN